MQVYLISNPISIQANACDTLEIKYRNRFNGFEMVYENDDEWVNQNRFGGYLRTPKRITTEKVYRQTNGVFRSGNVSIDKTYDLCTDLMDEETHDALAVALKHSDVQIGDNYYFHQGAYETQDNDYNNLEEGDKVATLLLQGFNQTNIRCS